MHSNSAVKHALESVTSPPRRTQCHRQPSWSLVKYQPSIACSTLRKSLYLAASGIPNPRLYDEQAWGVRPQGERRLGNDTLVNVQKGLRVSEYVSKCVPKKRSETSALS